MKIKVEGLGCWVLGFGVWGLHLRVEGVEEVEEFDGPRERRRTLNEGLGLQGCLAHKKTPTP